MSRLQLGFVARRLLGVSALVISGTAMFAGSASAQNTRCCFKVTANVLGNLSLTFPEDPRMAWQGRRDYFWSAREVGLYEIEDIGGAWLFYDLHPRTKIKGGASEIGTLTYNFRSPDPPDVNRGEPEASNCEQTMSTGQKWKWSQGTPGEGVGESELIDREAGGDELRITVNERLTQMHHDDVKPFSKSGECEHELVDHHGDTGGNDGLPITDYPEIPTPAPLRGRNLPGYEELRKRSPFDSKQKVYTGGHQPAGPIESSTHHSSAGTSRVKWVRFDFFPRKQLKQEIEAFKKLE